MTVWRWMRRAIWRRWKLLLLGKRTSNVLLDRAETYLENEELKAIIRMCGTSAAGKDWRKVRAYLDPEIRI